MAALKLFGLLYFLSLVITVKLQESCTVEFLEAVCNPEVPLTVIPNDIEPSSVRIFHLQNNKISAIYPGNLSFYPILNTLDLTNNLITVIPSNLENENVDTLRILTLNDNPIVTIEDRAFEFISDLATLNLQGTSLVSLTADTFYGLGELVTLNLRDSKLQTLSNDSFKHSTQLKTLNLRDNNLQTIPQGIFDNFIHGTLAISLGGNPWSCDCRLKWFRTYLDVMPEDFDDVTAIQCHWPHPSVPILDLTPNDFNCSELSIANQPTNDSIVTDRSYTLTITITGSPFPTNITWYRDNEVVTLNDNVRLAGVYDASLYFNNTMINHTGVYYVELSNEYGTVTSDTATLIVTEVTCFNNQKDDHETDIDCGGVFCKTCNQSQRCLVDSDCTGDLVCLYSHQLSSGLHYISPNNLIAYTCENESVAVELLDTRLQVAMQSVDLFGSNFTSEDVIDGVQVSMRKILSEKLSVNEAHISDVRVTTVERKSADSQPLLQIWFSLVKNSQGRAAQTTLLKLMDDGELSGTVRINEDKSYYNIRINL